MLCDLEYLISNLFNPLSNLMKLASVELKELVLEICGSKSCEKAND
jgi:hypothetical protein